MSIFESEAIPNIRPAAHAANAMELADGSLFAVWYCGSYEGAEDQRIAGSVKRPGGAWSPPHVVVDRFDFEGDAWIPEIGVPFPGPGGELYIYFWAIPFSSFSLRGEPPKWVRSIPESKLFFSPLLSVDFYGSAESDYAAGKPQKISDEKGLVFQGSALRLASGRWVIPFHTERRELWFHSRFLVSDDGGRSWSVRGDIYAEPGCLEPSVAQLPSGEVLCYMRRGGKMGHIWKAVSSDDCETFSEPIQTNLRNPHSGVDIAVGASGRLLIAYNDSYCLRTPLCVGISEDGGRTFRVRDVEVREGEYSYPKLLQARDGVWHLFYTHRRTHIQHAWFDEGWVEGGRKVIGL
ncbi:MAG: exo-alpha-sialidase [bacterium]